MCTVTFIPCGDSIYLTSGRDEQTARPPAEFPRLHVWKGQSLLFPRDSRAGGSWIAVHPNGNSIVLLNGAKKKHPYLPPYKKSRGLVLLEIISCQSPQISFQEMDMDGIEPYTIILIENKRLIKGIWDGKVKNMELLDHKQPFIWSSVTLYDRDTIKNREFEFSQWMKENPDPGLGDIVFFHRKAGVGDSRNELRMNRNDNFRTQSICTMVLTEEAVHFHYLDLLNDEIFNQRMNFQKTKSVFE